MGGFILRCLKADGLGLAILLDPGNPSPRPKAIILVCLALQKKPRDLKKYQGFSGCFLVGFYVPKDLQKSIPLMNEKQGQLIVLDEFAEFSEESS